MVMESRISQMTQRLRAWGLSGLTATLLENAGPLAFLSAQALYFTTPALSLIAPEDDVTALARLLEDPQAVQALARELSEEDEA